MDDPKDASAGLDGAVQDEGGEFLGSVPTISDVPPEPMPGSTLGATAFSPSLLIADGGLVAVAVDEQRRILHLFHTLPRRLVGLPSTIAYRVGNFAGQFSKPYKWETFKESIGMGHAIVTGDGAVHLTFSAGSHETFYTRVKDGAWSEKLLVISREQENLNRTITPSMFVDGSTAYVGTFTVGVDGNEQWGMLARIGDLLGQPKVEKRTPIWIWNPQVFVKDGVLWAGGRNRARGDRAFTFQRHDKTTLAETGAVYKASGENHGEMARASMDHLGEIHAAGTYNGGAEAQAGWYNTLSRAQAGKPAFTYSTTNRNANGMGLPLRDRKAANRVYVFYFSGAKADNFEPAGCAPGNQMRFALFENDAKVSELNSITDRTVSHNGNHRSTPGADVNPDGGMFVFVNECEGGGIRFIQIGGRRPGN